MQTHAQIADIYKHTQEPFLTTAHTFKQSHSVIKPPLK